MPTNQTAADDDDALSMTVIGRDGKPRTFFTPEGSRRWEAEVRANAAASTQDYADRAAAYAASPEGAARLDAINARSKETAAMVRAALEEYLAELRAKRGAA